MVIMTKQAALFMSHGEKWRVPNGYVGECPDWVTKTRQFNEMVADGVIVATASTSDKAMEKAAEKAAKKPKETTEPTGEKAAE